MCKPVQRKQDGFILVVVLCMVIMLSALLLGFNYQSRSSLRKAVDFRNSQQALNCARAGLNVALAAVKNPDETPTNPKLSRLLSGRQSFEFGGGNCSVLVTQENGKLNLNFLKNSSGQPDRRRTDQLLRLVDVLNREQPALPAIGYGLAPAIIDWIDADDEVTCLPFIKTEPLGAESPCYRGLTPPYDCKNAPLDTTDELLLIRGITAQVLDRLGDHVTVYGDDKVNINSASRQVIECLSEKMDPALTKTIVEQRKLKPFESVAALEAVPGMTDSIYGGIKPVVTVQPANLYYQVISKADVDKVNCTATIVLFRSDRKSTIVAVLRKNAKTETIEVVSYKEF